jgi:hypothetical protein
LKLLMADPACVALGIPERLQTEGREPDSQFEDSEFLYRRIANGYERRDLIAAFNLKSGESVNRQKYSRYPEDVLFNIVDGNHHVGSTILAFEVRQVRQQFPQPGSNQVVTYSFRLEHKPEDCMYPHCEIEVWENGRLADRVPGSLRRKLRDSIVDSNEKQLFTNCSLPAD